MAHRNPVSSLAELEAAVRDDEHAKAEAMQCGLDATLPLKPVRALQLCELGERMLETGRRVERARIDVDLAMPYEQAKPAPRLRRFRDLIPSFVAPR